MTTHSGGYVPVPWHVLGAKADSDDGNARRVSIVDAYERVRHVVGEATRRPRESIDDALVAAGGFLPALQQMLTGRNSRLDFHRARAANTLRTLATHQGYEPPRALSHFCVEVWSQVWEELTGSPTGLAPVIQGWGARPPAPPPSAPQSSPTPPFGTPSNATARGDLDVVLAYVRTGVGSMSLSHQLLAQEAANELLRVDPAFWRQISTQIQPNDDGLLEAKDFDAVSSILNATSERPGLSILSWAERLAQFGDAQLSPLARRVGLVSIAVCAIYGLAFSAAASLLFTGWFMDLDPGISWWLAFTGTIGVCVLAAILQPMHGVVRRVIHGGVATWILDTSRQVVGLASVFGMFVCLLILGGADYELRLLLGVVAVLTAGYVNLALRHGQSAVLERTIGSNVRAVRTMVLAVFVIIGARAVASLGSTERMDLRFDHHQVELFDGIIRDTPIIPTPSGGFFLAEEVIGPSFLAKLSGKRGIVRLPKGSKLSLPGYMIETRPATGVAKGGEQEVTFSIRSVWWKEYEKLFSGQAVEYRSLSDERLIEALGRGLPADPSEPSSTAPPGKPTSALNPVERPNLTVTPAAGTSSAEIDGGVSDLTPGPPAALLASATVFQTTELGVGRRALWKSLCRDGAMAQRFRTGLRCPPANAEELKPTDDERDVGRRRFGEVKRDLCGAKDASEDYRRLLNCPVL